MVANLAESRAHMVWDGTGPKPMEAKESDHRKSKLVPSVQNAI